MRGGVAMSDVNDRPQAELSRAALARMDPLALLEVNVAYDGWEHETAAQKAFYVRGFTWFRDKVLVNKLNITDCKLHIPKMKEILADRPGWTSTNFNWNEDFGSRQFVDSASPKNQLTPKFHKAAEVILLCETIAGVHHEESSAFPSPDEVYDRMRIEPAVSFIEGLDREVMQTLSPEQLNTLRKWTGQSSNAVFFDMADGKTVTDKLARRTARFFERQLPLIALGDVENRYSPRRDYRPTKLEKVDVKESDIPPEARAGAALTPVEE
jgi:hypothetical protein